MGWEVALGLLISGAAAAANNEQVARRQDRTAASAIQAQGRKQRVADGRVASEIDKLADSTSQDERATRLDQYMQTLAKSRSGMEGGLTPGIGSGEFQRDSASAADAVRDYAAKSAGLMSRIDAPMLQRQGEGFGYGNLATDIGMISRESEGQRFLDELRMKAIRRNPWLDAVSSAAGGYARGRAGGGTSEPQTMFGPGTI